jgi:transposase, IS30 family
MAHMHIHRGKHYQHLSYEERVRLDTLRQQGQSIGTIARQLNRSPNTISRELRLKRVKGLYTPRKAHLKAYHKRLLAKRNCLKVAIDPALSRLVIEKLPLRWSPERIAGYARQQGIVVSKKAIYKYVKSRWLQRHLVFKGRRIGRSTHLRRARYSRDRLKRTVDQRPPVEATGHWEVDFITAYSSKAALFVASDRFSRKTVIELLADRRTRSVERALQNLKTRYGIKTITTDNDLAFTKWRELEAAIGANFYFARPFASWEKGLVENSNRWIRLFIPKGTDMRDVSDDTVRSSLKFLNQTPRQVLGFQTADEVHYACRSKSKEQKYYARCGGQESRQSGTLLDGA